MITLYWEKVPDNSAHYEASSDNFDKSAFAGTKYDRFCSKLHSVHFIKSSVNDHFSSKFSECAQVIS